METPVCDDVRELLLPPEPALRDLLLPRHAPRHVLNVTDQMEHAERPLLSPKPNNHLVHAALAQRLDGQLIRPQQMRDRVGHGREKEVAGRGVHKVEMPAAGREQPKPHMLAEQARDAPAPFDDDGARWRKLGEPEPR